MDTEITTTADDSTGATEAEIATQDQIEGEGQSASADGGANDLIDDRFYEIDGEEVSESAIKQWKSGHMKDADYTQKTQKLSQDRKELEASRAQFGEMISAMSELENEIATMAMGDLQNIDMDELRDQDPSEYLRVKELKEDRAMWREKLSARLNEMRGRVTLEAHEVLKKQHGWTDEAKWKADGEAITSYVNESGMDQRDFAKITSPHVMTAILEAARYRKLMAEKPSITKRVVQAPKTSKPSQTSQKAPLSLAERMYGGKKS